MRALRRKAFRCPWRALPLEWWPNSGYWRLPASETAGAPALWINGHENSLYSPQLSAETVPDRRRERCAPKTRQVINEVADRRRQRPDASVVLQRGGQAGRGCLRVRKWSWRHRRRIHHLPSISDLLFGFFRWCDCSRPIPH